MEKITIMNFGPIKDAQLEIKDLTIIFGTQAAGKSVIAKLLKVFNSSELVSTRDLKKILNDYNLELYLRPNTHLQYENNNRIAEYSGGKYSDSIPDYAKFKWDKLTYDKNLEKNKGETLVTAFDVLSKLTNIDELSYNLLLELLDNQSIKDPEVMYDFLNKELRNSFIRKYLSDSIYIPSERNIFSLISNSVFSLMSIPIPKCIQRFGALIEKSRKSNSNQIIPFIPGLTYTYENESIESIEYMDSRIPIAYSASGFQSAIPLALVCNNESIIGKKHFLIEEPEQNLFPTTQMRLVKYLAEKCLLKSNRLLITTHSPYIVSSFDNLMQAGRIGKAMHKQASLMKVIPKKLWVDMSRVSAYYIADGTARDMVDKRHKCIDAKYLDRASDLIGAEHTKLLHIEYKQ